MTGWLLALGLAVQAVALAPAALPPQRLAIAELVARQGAERCDAVEADGRRAPCAVRFSAAPGRRVNAWAQGSDVAISRAALERLSDDEFALLAGHEVAHLLLRHGQTGPANELAADRLGAELACRAGYDPARGTSLFRHLHAGSTHPPAAQRRAAVLAVSCSLANSFTVPR